MVKLLNAIYLLAHSAVETGWGTSGIVRNKYNYYGIGAIDSQPAQGAFTFDSKEGGIIAGALWIKKNYVARELYASNYAYSQPNVATVTPLSNNATLVSVPEGLKRNELPENISLDDYADLVEKVSYNEKSELPTGHGFCLYIRREVLNKVGYFDEESFGKGYGEENDFSYRCLDYGYINLLCDNTIIFHKEGQSFENTRNEVLEAHMKILKER